MLDALTQEDGNSADDSDGDIIDVEVVDISDAPAGSVFNPFDIKPEPAPKTPEKEMKALPPGKPLRSGPPTLDEWQDFIGRVVLRTATDFYLSLILRDIEGDLSDRELQSIRLTKEDLKDFAAPIASLANKSKFAKKRGRSIIAAADSMEAVVALVIWMKRVNRIAKKYRKTQPVQGYVMQEENHRGNSGINDEQGSGQGPVGSTAWNVYNPGAG